MIKPLKFAIVALNIISLSLFFSSCDELMESDEYADIKRDFSTTVSVFSGDVDSEGYTDNFDARFHHVYDVVSDGNGNLYAADRDNNCIRKIDVNGWVTTFAGNGDEPAGFVNGDRLTARFDAPSGVAVGSDGIVFVADSGNNCIRKIDLEGTVTTLTTQCNNPMDLLIDESGCVIFANTGDNQICTVDESGITTVLAGLIVSGYVNGTADVARFNSPSGVALDADGNIYVSDTNNYCIRKIDTDGNVSTLAGTNDSGYRDGDADISRFSLIYGIAVDTGGSIIVADSGNSCIRKISPAGEVSTVAGRSRYTGYADGIGDRVRLNRPRGICVNQAGAVFIADSENSCIRKIHSDGYVSTFAGKGNYDGYMDSRTFTALFSRPNYLCSDSAGNVIFTESDGSSESVRRIDEQGFVSTLWQGSYPSGVGVDQDGNVWVADYYENSIWKIDPEGAVSHVAGSEDSNRRGYTDGPADLARFYSPSGIVLDSAGNVFIADSGNDCIRKIDTNGIVSTYAGTGTEGYRDGPAETARFNNPKGIDIDGNGNIYVADYGNSVIRKITPAGQVNTIAGKRKSWPDSDSHDHYIESDAFDVVIDDPADVLVDRITGNLYITDLGDDCVWVLRPTGMVFALAGNRADTRDYVEWIGDDQGFGAPIGMCFDADGNILVADRSRHCIWQVSVEWEL